MAESPGITYHLPDREYPLGPGDPRWHAPLPSHPSPVCDARPPSAAGESHLTLGEYFSAIARFLARNNYRGLRRAVQMLNPALAPGHPRKIPWQIKIVCEKHGALYHPARIRVGSPPNTLDLVVNLALSARGREVLPREVENLLRLELEFQLPYLPRVFGSGEEALDDHRCVALFLGEWFSNHWEFHLARNPHTGQDGIHVWDPGRQGCFLDPLEMELLFHQAARILTCYYNPITTEQVYPWHHAAGDFLWGRDKTTGEASVKLITVRGYQPLLHDFPSSPTLRDVVDGLSLFLLNMSLRMRLDRCNGVGDWSWLDSAILTAVLDGFGAGLARQCPHYGLPGELVPGLRSHLAGLALRDLRDLYQELVARVYPVGGGEQAVVLEGLDRHIHDLKCALGS